VALSHVHFPQPSDTHFERLRAELERRGAVGNLTIRSSGDSGVTFVGDGRRRMLTFDRHRLRAIFAADEPPPAERAKGEDAKA
jgi:hypothetical protein